MKKYILSGALGVTIGTTISLMMSAIFGKGVYLPVNPMSTMGSYYQAHFTPVIVMAIAVAIWFVIGLLFEVADLCFKQNWSLLQMSVTHFILTSVGFTGLGILAGWFPLDLAHLLFFWAIYLALYGLLYWINYEKMKQEALEINKSLH
ncbi:DUF3021 domain-containing protein [Streptococcus merionis]|uniref:DUF3021 domain-containing protein n=1 Tax=Streptococcus merionis TaxID=400065 RepID=UPI0026E9F31F|nr:DUF3021 domain-containing protein [Streptococcus merionis]